MANFFIRMFYITCKRSIFISDLILSPINKQYIADRKVLDAQPKTILESKPDSVEFHSKITKDKKMKYLAFGIAGALLLAGGLIGINLLIKNGKLPGLKKVHKYADKVKNQAEVLKEEVMELYNNGGMKDGKQVAKISSLDDGKELMEEFLENGSISRATRFDNKTPDKIEVFKKGFGKSDTYRWLDGKLDEYWKGYKKFADGSEKIAKMLWFEDGKLSEYQKGYKEFADGSEKIAKMLWFKDGKLSEYQKGYKEFADGSKKIAKKLSFDYSGKLSEYQKGYKQFVDGSEKGIKIDFTKGIFPKIERINNKASNFADNVDDLAGDADDFLDA